MILSLNYKSSSLMSIFRPRKANAATPDASMTLFDASAGIRCRVVALNGCQGTCHRLREMGFCENAQITKISKGGSTVCTVCGSRVALSRKLAKSIVVE